MNNFPYYPEPLNDKTEKQTSTPAGTPFADLLKNMENLNTDNLLSAMLSSGMFGQSQNSGMVQILGNLLTKKNTQTKEKEVSQPPSFEDL